jgi:integrase
MGELDVRMLIRAAKPGRDQLMLETGYFGGLRVSELVSLMWSQVILPQGCLPQEPSVPAGGFRFAGCARLA